MTIGLLSEGWDADDDSNAKPSHNFIGHNYVGSNADDGSNAKPVLPPVSMVTLNRYMCLDMCKSMRIILGTGMGIDVNTEIAVRGGECMGIDILQVVGADLGTDLGIDMGKKEYRHGHGHGAWACIRVCRHV